MTEIRYYKLVNRELTPDPEGQWIHRDNFVEYQNKEENTCRRHLKRDNELTECIHEFRTRLEERQELIKLMEDLQVSYKRIMDHDIKLILDYIHGGGNTTPELEDAIERRRRALS